MVHSQSSNIPLLCQGCWNLPLKLAQPAKNKAILWWNTVQCKSAKQIKMNAFFKLAANSCMLVCVTQWRGLWTTGLCCNQTPGKNGNQLCLAIPKEKRRIRFFFFFCWSDQCLQGYQQGCNILDSQKPSNHTSFSLSFGNFSLYWGLGIVVHFQYSKDQLY